MLKMALVCGLAISSDCVSLILYAGIYYSFRSLILIFLILPPEKYMINKFKLFFDKYLISDEKDTDSDERRLHLAATVLLVEMVRVDQQAKPEEQTALVEGVSSTFGLSEQETSELIQLAEQEANDATSYHTFTSLINQGFSKQQKISVVELLWEIAYADFELEMYEEHLVRKLADLLYVSHSDFIAAKLRVQARMGIA